MSWRSSRAARRLSREVIRRDGGVCWLCHRPGADTADHLLPRAHGGPDTLENLRAAHRVCNGRRGARVVLSSHPTRDY